MFLALSACPTGWLYDPGETPEVAKLAVETGLPAVEGSGQRPRDPHLYAEAQAGGGAFLKRQGRFRHLFEPVRQEAAIRHIQERVDEYWKRVTAETAWTATTEDGRKSAPG
ncbi:MAG: hypothetical protein U0361_19790 [Nitrospiraceae bacterium]